MINGFSKPKVLLLGTFHMGKTPDMYHTEVGNLFSKTRQQEIRDVVDRLKRFNPTKVALEIVTEDDKVINNKYKAYVNGQFQLEGREQHQLGFRIASELGHERIYPIDWMDVGVATRPFGEVYEWTKTNQPELFNEIFQKEVFNNNANKSILEMYQSYNEPDKIKKSHELYINMARIGYVREYVGISWLTWWYQRNLTLFSNICRLVESADDRILVIIGSSHIYLLNQFLRESNMVELVDVNKLLLSND
ncbi:DUF5694 domain-containing protein [Haloimpatiens massiliensis]|uniref:DUF5694 domain-containing protein n=1 Tax=Haloimpatiens massiliensis TaxID=1658110 RepID=UPI000C81EC6C|nr:DUF5694 domain-containing protein [Haloimpatiens massiliensis]